MLGCGFILLTAILRYMDRSKNVPVFEVEDFGEGEKSYATLQSATVLGRESDNLFVLAVDAYWTQNDDDYIYMTEDEYKDLDEAGLTYNALLMHLYSRRINAAKKYDKVDGTSWVQSSLSEKLDEGRRASIARVLANKSNKNKPMLVAAGVLYSLPTGYIAKTSMIDFFRFWCEVNYDFSNPTFKTHQVVQMFKKKAEWAPLVPYLQLGITDMALIRNAIADGVDPQLVLQVL